jgi:hypothetical protein
MVEADDPHGYSAPRRMAAYRWFSRWLKGVEDSEPEHEIPVASEEELWCTKSGQVSGLPGSETVHSLNRARAAGLAGAKGSPPSAADVARTIGFERPASTLAVHPFGEIRRPGLRIEKLVYEMEAGNFVPALLYLPASGAGKRPGTILVHGGGKSAAAAHAEAFAKAGMVVLSIDARDFGERRGPADPSDREWNRYFADYETAMTAILLGRTLAGLRAADIVRGLDVLAARPEVNADRLSAFGSEGGAVPLLHAAALDRRIRALALERMLISYRAVVDRPVNRGIFEQVVPGVLKAYDLPSLAAMLAPRPVWIVDAADPAGQAVPEAQVSAAYSGGRHIHVERTTPQGDTLAPYRGFIAAATRA